MKKTTRLIIISCFILILFVLFILLKLGISPFQLKGIPFSYYNPDKNYYCWPGTILIDYMSPSTPKFKTEFSLDCSTSFTKAVCSPCGNGVCDSKWENYCNCPEDCKEPVIPPCTKDSDCGNSFCVNGVCKIFKNCGDGICKDNENRFLCPQDCK